MTTCPLTAAMFPRKLASRATTVGDMKELDDDVDQVAGGRGVVESVLELA